MHSATQQMELRPLKAKTLTSWHFCWAGLHCFKSARMQPSLAKRMHVVLLILLALFPMPASFPRAITLWSADRTPTDVLGWSISRTKGYYGTKIRAWIMMDRTKRSKAEIYLLPWAPSWAFCRPCHRRTFLTESRSWSSRLKVDWVCTGFGVRIISNDPRSVERSNYIVVYSPEMLKYAIKNILLYLQNVSLLQKYKLFDAIMIETLDFVLDLSCRWSCQVFPQPWEIPFIVFVRISAGVEWKRVLLSISTHFTHVVIVDIFLHLAKQYLNALAHVTKVLCWQVPEKETHTKGYTKEHTFCQWDQFFLLLKSSIRLNGCSKWPCPFLSIFVYETIKHLFWGKMKITPDKDPIRKPIKVG